MPKKKKQDSARAEDITTAVGKLVMGIVAGRAELSGRECTELVKYIQFKEERAEQLEKFVQNSGLLERNKFKKGIRHG